MTHCAEGEKMPATLIPIAPFYGLCRCRAKSDRRPFISQSEREVCLKSKEPPHHSDEKGQTVGPKQSGLGIASLLVSILAAVVTFGLSLLAGLVDFTSPGGISESELSTQLLGLGIIGGMCVAAVALDRFSFRTRFFSARSTQVGARSGVRSWPQ